MEVPLATRRLHLMLQTFIRKTTTTGAARATAATATRRTRTRTRAVDILQMIDEHVSIEYIRRCWCSLKIWVILH